MSAARPPLAPDDPRHGTSNGYKNLHCRCDRCRAAWAAYTAELRAERIEFGLAADDPRHGKATTYGNWGCRCRPCRDAWAAARRGLLRRRALERLTGRQALAGAPDRQPADTGPAVSEDSHLGDAPEGTVPGGPR